MGTVIIPVWDTEKFSNFPKAAQWTWSLNPGHHPQGSESSYYAKQLFLFCDVRNIFIPIVAHVLMCKKGICHNWGLFKVQNFKETWLQKFQDHHRAVCSHQKDEVGLYGPVLSCLFCFPTASRGTLHIRTHQVQGNKLVALVQCLLQFDSEGRKREPRPRPWSSSLPLLRALCARLLAGQVQGGSGFLKPAEGGLWGCVTKLEILGRVIKKLKKQNKNNFYNY